MSQAPVHHRSREQVHDLPSAGIEVPYRTLHPYAAEELGFGGRGSTVPVVDGQPGEELQVDYGRLG